MVDILHQTYLSTEEGGTITCALLISAIEPAHIRGILPVSRVLPGKGSRKLFAQRSDGETRVGSC